MTALFVFEEAADDVTFWIVPNFAHFEVSAIPNCASVLA